MKTDKFMVAMLAFGLFISTFFLTGCEDDRMPYMVTSEGEKVTLNYIGDSSKVSPAVTEIFLGEKNLGNGKYADCILHTNKIPPSDQHCTYSSELQIGNIIKIHSSRIEPAERPGHYRLDLKYYDCSVESGDICEVLGLENIYQVSEKALYNTEHGKLSKRVDVVEKDISLVDKKVDKNLKNTVSAVKKLHDTSQIHEQAIVQLDHRVKENDEDIDSLSRSKYDESPAKKTGRLFVSEPKIKESEDNPFGFMEEENQGLVPIQ